MFSSLSVVKKGRVLHTASHCTGARASAPTAPSVGTSGLTSQFNENTICHPPYLVTPDIRAARSQVETDHIGWGKQLIGIKGEAWDLGVTGQGIKVAVLDTGVAYDHPDLKGQVVATADFTGEGLEREDINGHGTHCAGIVAARLNGLGVAGVAPDAKLLCGKVLQGTQGTGSDRMLADGVNWAVEQGSDIISMSLGAPRQMPETRRAIFDAINRGVIVIAAAGNDGSSWPFFSNLGYPGNYKEVICVGSIDRNAMRSGFSSTGANIDIVAPGGAILSCWPPEGLNRISGTSMATPFVAGVAALLLSKYGKKNQTEMFEMLKENAIDTGARGFDRFTGWGIVQLPQTDAVEEVSLA